MHKLSRRDALRGTGVAALAAGVAVVPFVGAEASEGRVRVRRALKALEAAVAAYYSRATRLQLTFNGVTPEDLATGKSVAVCMVLADRLDDPLVSRTADNPMSINDGYRGSEIDNALATEEVRS